jgi:hypothetical protein
MASTLVALLALGRREAGDWSNEMKPDAPESADVSS